MFSHYKMSHFISAFLLLLIMSLFFTSCRQTAEPQHTPDQSTAAPSEGHLPVSTPIATPMPTDTATAEPEKIRAMPILRIDTKNNREITSKEEYVSCNVSAENCKDSEQFQDATAQIRIRGNSTATAEKKPYRLRFDKKQSLFGMNNNAECKNWCLMADYFDPSMMRTSMAFRLADTLLEGKYYSSDFTYAEVYINNEYEGVYLICEQSQINPNRIAIFDKEDGYTGTDIGYLMIGQGGRTDEPNTLRTNANVLITDLNGESSHCGSMIFSLSGGDYTAEQIRFIEDWCTAAFEAVYNAIYLGKYYTIDENCTLQPKTDFTENASASEMQQQTIGALIDLESAVRMYLLDEIVKNLDAGTFNMYVDMSASGNHKLTFAAPWDFDFALGNTQYDTTYSPEGLYAANFSYSDGVRTNSWYVMLNGAGWFRERVRAVWQEKYSALLADADEILRLSEKYTNEFTRNYEKWDLLGQKLLFHQHDSVCNYKTQYDAALFLSNWLKMRLEWLNTEWSKSIDTQQKIDFTNLDFTEKHPSGTLGMYHCCEGVLTEEGYIFTVTDPTDPYFAILYSRSDEMLSADEYRYFEITYKVPAENSLKEYTAELFLVAGETTVPTAGKSFRFTYPADNEFQSMILDLGFLDFWHGKIHMIRIDFFCESAVNDGFQIRSARLLKETS